MNAIIFKNISWTGVTEGETNQGNCVASNDVFSELRPRSDWHHYKLLHHFSSVTNAAMQRYLETSLSLLHLPIHAHSPTDTHRHLMCTANFHNVLKDMRNYFKRLITITAFFYTVLQIAETPWKLAYPFISSDKTQDYGLQTSTTGLSSSKNTVQNHCVLLMERRNKYCSCIPLLYVVFP